MTELKIGDRVIFTPKDGFGDPRRGVVSYMGDHYPHSVFVRYDATGRANSTDVSCLQIEPSITEALHASAPDDHKCADCQIDQEPCPRCYAFWWTERHPNTRFVEFAQPEQTP